MAPLTRSSKPPPAPAPPTAAAAAAPPTTASPPGLSFSDPVNSIARLLFDGRQLSVLVGLLLVGEVILSGLIIRFVPYTEIDWTTYMEQVRLFIAGERDYSQIEGSTGPLVYPAGHLWAYTGLYYLTQHGTNILRAQVIFAAIYVATQAIVFKIYSRLKSVPPYVLILLTLSKRLHSIYMLRMFNDGVGMLFFYSAVLLWTAPRPRWTAGCVLFSLALSVKMNFLLYAPALAYLLWTSLGPLPSLVPALAIALPQVLLAAPFLHSSETAMSYLHRAFDLGREFDFKWTVNWRWLGKDLFESQELRGGLLMFHVVGLVGLGFAWAACEGGLDQVLLRGVKKPMRPAGVGQPSADRILMILFTANMLGITLARSLHYQFYAWFAHQLPFLLWQCPFDIVRRLAGLGAIEWAWNAYPSTDRSSMTATMASLILLVGTATAGHPASERFVARTESSAEAKGVDTKKNK